MVKIEEATDWQDAYYKATYLIEQLEKRITALEENAGIPEDRSFTRQPQGVRSRLIQDQRKAASDRNKHIQS